MGIGDFWKLPIVGLLVTVAGPAAACPRCREQARAAIADSGFPARLGFLLLPVIILAGAAMLLHGTGRGRATGPKG